VSGLIDIQEVHRLVTAEHLHDGPWLVMQTDDGDPIVYVELDPAKTGPNAISVLFEPDWATEADANLAAAAREIMPAALAEIVALRRAVHELHAVIVHGPDGCGGFDPDPMPVEAYITDQAAADAARGHGVALDTEPSVRMASVPNGETR
jgi:hypothetical protein